MSFHAIKEKRLLGNFRYHHRFSGLHYLTCNPFANLVANLALVLFGHVVRNFDGYLVAVRRKEADGSSVHTKFAVKRVQNLSDELLLPCTAHKYLVDHEQCFKLTNMLRFRL